MPQAATRPGNVRSSRLSSRRYTGEHLIVCTVIAAVGLSAQWPVLLATVRDESVERRWQPPAAHWPEHHPQLIGGLDMQSGGTWLALNTLQHRASFLVNRVERAAGETRSRGDLPLLALQEPERHMNANCLRPYNGFILGLADVNGLVLHQWDTQSLHSVRLDKGLHGLCYRGIGEDHPRLARHLPRFATSSLPQPITTACSAQAWGQWLQLLADNGQYSSDADALMWRRNVEGDLWASQSATCLALGVGQSRLDFSATPLDPTSWSKLPLPYPLEREC
ncbi:NRDE family protein [Pseudomonas marginalis]|nr:NRDE family protein [Pseudomonas marginalis]